jgi:hypothetical protein
MQSADYRVQKSWPGVARPDQQEQPQSNTISSLTDFAHVPIFAIWNWIIRRRIAS